jgi:ABC-2 type transport system permease protein
VTKVLAIAWKDLRSVYRAPSALAMMLAAPLAIAVLLGAAFGGDEGFSLAPTRVLLVNLDAAPSGANQGETLAGVLESDPLKDLLIVDRGESEEDARARVDEGDAAVAVIVPADFTQTLGSPEARTSTVLLYKDPTKDLGPGIVRSVVQRIVDTLNGARAAGVAAVSLEMPGGTAPDAEQLAVTAQEAAQTFIARTQSAQTVQLETLPPSLPDAERTKDVSVTGTVLVGMMVFFMFFAASNAARTILDEDAGGTLRRMFTTPSSRSVILAGKMTSVFLTVLVQSVVLLLAGRLIFRVDWGGILPVALLTAAGVATAAGLAVLLLSIARTPAQAGAYSSGVFLVLALVGGNFVGGMPPDTVFDTVRRFTPNGWLIVGWESTMRGGGVADTLLPAAIALAFGVATFVLGALLFRRRYA